MRVCAISNAKIWMLNRLCTAKLERRIRGSLAQLVLFVDSFGRRPIPYLREANIKQTLDCGEQFLRRAKTIETIHMSVCDQQCEKLEAEQNVYNEIRASQLRQRLQLYSLG